MKILVINHQARPEFSGVASHFENISKNLLALSCEVVRLVAKDPAFVKKNKKIEYHYFNYDKKNPKQTKLENEKRVKMNYANFEKSLKKLDWKKIDAVITSNDIYLSILKKYIAPEKMLAIIPSSLTFSKTSNPKGYLKVLKRLKKNVKGVRLIVLSDKMKGMLSALLGDKYKIDIVPPGVDHSRFSIKEAPKRKNQILFVGRVSKEKNVEALINAMSLVKTNCSLTIIGKGDSFEKVIALTKKHGLEDKIIFTGRQEKVERYYTQASLFILPSRYEAFGLVILEAMSSGLPVIAFHPSKKILTASDEIIDDTVDGFLVKNTKEMAEKIDYLMANKKILKRMGEKALLKSKKYTWPNHTQNLLNLLTNTK